jgi:uncharacterized protein
MIPPDDMTFDVSPYLKLFIDKDGRWFQNGKEIIHTGIYRMFNSLLEKTPNGEYQIRKGQEICRVEVEDAPFLVTRLDQQPNSDVCISLNDGSCEQFDADHLWIASTNIPYCLVKKGLFHARFSRPAYYQLAAFIVEDCGEFFFVLGEKRFAVQRGKQQ